MVASKPSLSLSNEVSVKDDFFIHTPRKTIAELFESKQVMIHQCNNTFVTIKTLYLCSFLTFVYCDAGGEVYCDGYNCGY